MTKPLSEPTEIEGETKDDRHFVTALARGLEVLSAFRRGETFLANQEIAERCNLPRSTVSRLTYTLTKLGYLHLVEETGLYRLGTQLIALGSTALGGLTVREIARPGLSELAEFSGATVGLGVRDTLSMRYVECVRGPSTIMVNIDIGTRISMTRTAMGRAYIAVLTEPERLALFDRLRDRDPLAWPKLRASLEKAVEEHATTGCCTSFGDWQENVNSIAIGFRPGGGLDPMAINCGAPSVVTDATFLLEAVRPKMIEMVRQLEGVMGV